MTIWPTKEDFVRRKERRIRIRKKIHEIHDNLFRKKLKKQPFIWMFAKVFLIFLCIAIAAIYAGWTKYRYILKTEYEGYLNSGMDSAKMWLNREINYPLDLDKNDNTRWKYFLEEILSFASAYTNSNISLSLYSLDDKEFVAEATYDTFIELVDEDKNEHFVYRLSDDVSEAFLNVVQSYASDYWNEFQYLNSMVLKDIYIDDSTFIPGTCYDDFNEYYEAVFAPKDKNAYKHWELEGIKAGTFADNYNFYTPDGLRVDGPYFAISEPTEEMTKAANIIDAWMESNSPWAYVDFGHSNITVDKSIIDMYTRYKLPDNELINADISQQLIDLGNGNRYLLVGATYYDLTGHLHEYLKTWCTRAAIICILLSLLIAYFKFNVQKARLMQDEYRRSLTNTMAHDLKTPLMAISGYAENLLANVQTEKREHYAKTIVKNVDYMNALINNILQLDKLESNLKLNRENIELSEMTETLIKNYDVLIEEKNLMVNVVGTLTINADLELMKQVIDNLLVNAVKYSTNGSVISITLEDNTFTIENETDVPCDTALNDLWKPYVKGNNSRSDRKGNGIGLYIVDNIVKLHNYKATLALEENYFTVKIIF